MQTGLLYYFLSSSNFSLFERKVTKEANNLRQVDRLFWPRLYTESPLKAKGISLLAVLWGYRSFHSIVLRTGYADRTVTPPTAYFFPTFIGLQISYLFFYGTFPINKIHLKSKCCCPGIKHSGIKKWATPTGSCLPIEVSLVSKQRKTARSIRAISYSLKKFFTKSKCGRAIISA